VAERQDKIDLFYLPSSSPELDPAEGSGADLKYASAPGGRPVPKPD
jgi:hypothetical protein